MTKKRLVHLAVAAAMITALSACGGASSSGDLPRYPGATELQAGESAVGDTLAKNMGQDAAMRKAMGTGGKTEQLGFRLPGDASWDKVKAFYDKELKAGGWESGLGGLAGGFIDVNAVMGAANQGNELFQTAMWSRGKQTLTVVMAAGPSGQRELILSLSSR